MTTFAFTGHRPKDLPPHVTSRFVENVLDDVIPELCYPDSDKPQFVTGGALGIDTYAADYALQRGYDLHLVLPFDPNVMSRFWTPQSTERLMYHVDQATTYEILCPTGYDVSFYQKRNVRMVELSDVVLAFWTGKTHGGTWNCIEYARKVKPTFNLINGKVENIMANVQTRMDLR